MQDLLGIFQLANSGKDIWMAYKSVKSLPVSSQVPRYDSPVRPTDRSIEMYQRPGIFTPSTECPREPEVFRRCTAIPSSIIADKHITLQNIGDILCRLRPQFAGRNRKDDIRGRPSSQTETGMGIRSRPETLINLAGRHRKDDIPTRRIRGRPDLN